MSQALEAIVSDILCSLLLDECLGSLLVMIEVLHYLFDVIEILLSYCFLRKYIIEHEGTFVDDPAERTHEVG